MHQVLLVIGLPRFIREVHGQFGYFAVLLQAGATTDDEKTQEVWTEAWDQHASEVLLPPPSP